MQSGKRIVIGVGGNIGAGKTTVCKIFEALGGKYISADEVGWEVLPQIAKALRKKFGKAIMNGTSIDKRKLRATIFAKRENVESLNRLSHPILIQKIKKRIANIKSGIVIIDAALLYDWPEITHDIDYSILVTAKEELKLKRRVANGLDQHAFLQIRRYQKDDGVLAQRAGFIVNNNGTLAKLRTKCRKIYKEIKDDC